MATTSPKVTAKQVLDAALQSEAGGNNDYAIQFYRHVVEHFPDAPEVHSARDALLRILGAPTPSTTQAADATNNGNGHPQAEIAGQHHSAPISAEVGPASQATGAGPTPTPSAALSATAATAPPQEPAGNINTAPPAHTHPPGPQGNGSTNTIPPAQIRPIPHEFGAPEPITGVPNHVRTAGSAPGPTGSSRNSTTLTNAVAQVARSAGNSVLARHQMLSSTDVPVPQKGKARSQYAHDHDGHLTTAHNATHATMQGSARAANHLPPAIVEGPQSQNNQEPHNHEQHPPIPTQFLLPRTRDHYRMGHFISNVFGLLGWVILLAGISAAIAGTGLIPGTRTMIQFLPGLIYGAIGLILGLMMIFFSQLAKAVFDGANAARDLTAIERARIRQSSRDL